MRYFIISILAHILVVSFVWVGFSVPIGRGRNSFTYLGKSIALIQGPQEVRVSSQQVNGSEGMVFEQSSAAFFTPWLKMRQVDKPR